MKLTWYGHSAFRLEFKGAVVLIDPFLTGNPSFKGSVEDAARGVTHILLTHGHGDHFGDTVPLAKATGAKVVAEADLCGFLGAQGVEKLDPMNSGGTVDQGPFLVSMVTGHHSSGTFQNGVAQGLGSAHGLLVKPPGERVLYHMGDTDIFGDMALIAEIHEPRIGLVPIGDRFTMGGKVAAMACRRFFRFETVIPCHYGSFPIIDQTPDKFLDAMGEDRGKVRTPAVGETIEV
ncbi:metal-dependent hydrolase [Arenibaculum pallidiluteum]|uniref:metal-dependent hydrolase n=1 Tax=Arenibaculum pallidiluteum TaxID=2812559 RepID=UPI001A96A88C|nr:metal-dependent hydrolase [Arenibaculum pallidiluteum]